MKRFIIALFLVISLSGCDDDNHTKCFEYHEFIHVFRLEHTKHKGIVHYTEMFSRWEKPNFKVGDTVYCSDIMNRMQFDKDVISSEQYKILEVNSCKQ